MYNYRYKGLITLDRENAVRTKYINVARRLDVWSWQHVSSVHKESKC